MGCRRSPFLNNIADLQETETMYSGWKATSFSPTSTGPTAPYKDTHTTLAVVQSVWILPCFNEAWKNCVNVGVSSSASVLSNLVWSNLLGFFLVLMRLGRIV